MSTYDKKADKEDHHNTGAARSLLGKVLTSTYCTKFKKNMTGAGPGMANMTTAHSQIIPRRMSQWEAKSQTRIKCQARRNIPGTSISNTPSSRKSTAPAAP